MITFEALLRDPSVVKKRPLLLVVGEETFQSDEIFRAVKKSVLPESSQDDLSYESWDAEGIQVDRFLTSLEMLPGLFSGEGDLRLIVCRKFDKFPAASLESFEAYVKNPIDTTVVMLFASKVDKRKAWYRAIEEKGVVVEIADPYDRDWSKWKVYLENRYRKKISAEAWGLLVENSGKVLSLVAKEFEKLVLFCDTQKEISFEAVKEFLSPIEGADVFTFCEEVLMQKSKHAMEKYLFLLRSGESEVKMLSLLVRQFRLVAQCQKLLGQGNKDSKIVAQRLGVSPYFVNRYIDQAKSITPLKVEQSLSQLAECDYAMKTSRVSLFEGFLSGYLASSKELRSNK